MRCGQPRPPSPPPRARRSPIPPARPRPWSSATRPPGCPRPTRPSRGSRSSPGIDRAGPAPASVAQGLRCGIDPATETPCQGSLRKGVKDRRRGGATPSPPLLAPIRAPRAQTETFMTTELDPRAPHSLPEPLDPRATAESVLFEIRRVIVGQDEMLERVLVALLAGGHLLLEGVPGLAKTLTIRTLAEALDASFRRIQFTPDLVPADLVGTRIYRSDSSTFDTELGPVFCNFLLADEINRAPAKVQSALLEVMQERQVTIGQQTWPVPRPFVVMATQNPIESEGTYPLPEAQVDRFMMKVVVGYPSAAEEAT